MIIKCLESLIKEVPVKNEEGEIIDIKDVVLKKQMITLMDIQEEDIIAVKEHYNSRGRIYKDRCLINHRYLGNMIVKHNFVEMCKIKNSFNVTVKGFHNGSSKV